MKNIWIQTLIIFFLVILDQITKGVIQQNFHYGENLTVIQGLFDLTYVQNRGAAFGMGAEAHNFIRYFFFYLVPCAAVFWLLVLMWKERHRSFFMGLTYALIFAGACGNLFDRFMYGYVVDFLDFYWKDSHFPAFNVADSAITVAAFMLIYDALWRQRKKLKCEDETSKSCCPK